MTFAFKKTGLRLTRALGLAAALAACSDNKTTATDMDAAKASVGDAGVTTTDAGGDSGALPLGLVPPPKAIGMAALHSDYKTMAAAVSLLAADTGAVVKDECITSGSGAGVVSATLSSDLALPSEPQPGNKLVLIDRKQATLTWVNPSTCAIEKQLDVGTGFKSNPHDLIDLGSKAYVIRYNSKPTDAKEGNDVLVVDVAAQKITGRISLLPFAGADASGKDVLPAPDRMRYVGGKIYISLNNLGPNGEASTGRVAVLDPVSDSIVAAIDLPTLHNCGALSVVPGAKPALVVGCGGSWAAAKPMDNSGIAWIDLSGDKPAVEIMAALPFGKAVSLYTLAVVDGHLGFTIVSDFATGAGDQLWAFDFITKMARKVRDANASFVYSLFLNRDAKRLFLSEADPKTPTVHVLNTEGPLAPIELGMASSNPKTGLPPRGLAFY